MIRSISQIVFLPTILAVLISLTALGLVVSQSFSWSNISGDGLQRVYVGNCNTQQFPSNCCLYASFDSCKNQVGTCNGNCKNCKNTIILGSCGSVGSGTGPSCKMLAEGSPPKCAFAQLVIHTDSCELDGTTNADGTCHIGVYTPIGKNSPTTQVCNCNPTFSICTKGQPTTPCPTS